MVEAIGAQSAIPRRVHTTTLPLDAVAEQEDVKEILDSEDEAEAQHLPSGSGVTPQRPPGAGWR